MSGGKKRRLEKVEVAQGGWRRFEWIEQTRQEARKGRRGQRVGQSRTEE